MTAIDRRPLDLNEAWDTLNQCGPADGTAAAHIAEQALAEIKRLRAHNAELCEDLADLAQARAALDATRRMANDANAALRAQLLAALAWDDDGRTPLSGYIAHLVAQRDALKQALARAVREMAS